MNPTETKSETPKLVNYQTTEALREYFYRLIELGAIEGPVGEMTVSPAFADVLRAAHCLLAGGKVEIKVLDEGNRTVSDELAARMNESMRQSNAVNRAAGTYMTLSG
jgi:hypothetical protein